jgi:peptidoglycan/LPS O-acetylase OafA/YrhL
MTLNPRSLLARLVRNTSSGNYIPEIDGLRCLAIAMVIGFHLAGYVAEKTPTPFVATYFDTHLFLLLRTGHIGVQLFFIISGFVVALPFANHRLLKQRPVNLRRYFLRRVTRIEPPYVIALVFWLLAFGISGLGENHASFAVLLRHFPASLFYLHNLIYHEPSWVLPPAWSLEIEIQFYLLAPVLALVFCVRRQNFRRGILIFAIGGFALAQRWLRLPGQINGLHLDQEIHYFLIGLLLVDLYVVHWQNRPASNPKSGDALATVSLLALPVVLTRFPSQLLIAALLMSFVAGVMRSRYWRGLFRQPAIYTFGGMCYTTYLYHGFFKALPGHFTIGWQVGHHFGLNFLIQAALLTPIIVVGSVVLYLLTERPFMTAGRAVTVQPSPQSGL